MGLGLKVGLEMIWCEDGNKDRVKSQDEDGFGFGDGHGVEFGVEFVSKNRVRMSDRNGVGVKGWVVFGVGMGLGLQLVLEIELGLELELWMGLR